MCTFACDDDDTESTESGTGTEDAGAAGSGAGKGGSSSAGKGGSASAGKGGSSSAGKGGSASAGQGGSGTAGEGDGDSDAGTAPEGPADYAVNENWLCRPGYNKYCDVDLDTTIVNADGTLETEKFAANADAPIDCFYVYPTVSLDATPNSDLEPGDEEASVVRAQFARFASQCRLFAPVYRQVTLTALRANIAGSTSGPAPDRNIGYEDVKAAFHHYLENDNDGRGFVLIGHSQGSGVLTRLIKDELDGDEAESRFITALITGSNVLVPKDADVGGTYKNVPICKSADQLGCVITYASFRANTPPSDTTMFSTSSDPNLVAACTNPAALGGGSAELHSYLSAAGAGTSSAPMTDWATGKTVETPFVSVPGLITGECKEGKTGSYFAITINADADDPRTDDIVGDVVTNGEVQADWGLHLIDVHLVIGNLIDVVKAKADAYAKR
ncbi:MAG: DUF3089 domain-containing protein [Polyangiales bacterium]